MNCKSTYLSRTKYKSKAPWHDLSSSTSSCALADGSASNKSPKKSTPRHIFTSERDIVSYYKNTNPQESRRTFTLSPKTRLCRDPEGRMHTKKRSFADVDAVFPHISLKTVTPSLRWDENQLFPQCTAQKADVQGKNLKKRPPQYLLSLL